MVINNSDKVITF